MGLAGLKAVGLRGLTREMREWEKAETVSDQDADPTAMDRGVEKGAGLGRKTFRL